ncbi:MAG TPA: D-aminoacyl-tRNA deacylase [Tepidisphaeraceae bacterium]|jgi:D-tyrosyl-tRNA(Tyr) deacylase|nr:D-aminoacyl-tRNA deacylase [Tepidisphaeraceae bacterium]
MGFDALAQAIREVGVNVATGEFGADMQVQVVNAGAVTLIVDSDAR